MTAEAWEMALRAKPIIEINLPSLPEPNLKKIV